MKYVLLLAITATLYGCTTFESKPVQLLPPPVGKPIPPGAT